MATFGIILLIASVFGIRWAFVLNERAKWRKAVAGYPPDPHTSSRQGDGGTKV